jgi:hypothetical protein
MSGSRDITAVARSMIARHGRRAAHLMDERAKASLETGFKELSAYWERVAQAVRELDNSEYTAGADFTRHE